MENHHSSAAPPNAMGQTTSSGCPEKKDVAMPNLSSSEAEVSATVAGATCNGNLSKGKSVAAADNNKEQEPLKPHIIAERKRRVRINDYFSELQARMPQIPAKSGKGTIVGHAIHYIQSLERTKAMLEKRKQQQALARQAAALAAAASSSLPPPPPQSSVQGMALAAMSSEVPDACSGVLPPPLQPLASAVPVPVPAPQLLPATMSADVVILQPLAGAAQAPPPQLPAPAGPEFKTWSWPGLVVSVSNGSAHLNLCVPRDRGTRTMVTVVSVLNKYGIDVLTAQVDSDAVRSVFNIYARVTAMGGENPSAEDMYKQAVSEILALLNAS